MRFFHSTNLSGVINNITCKFQMKDTGPKNKTEISEESELISEYKKWNINKIFCLRHNKIVRPEKKKQKPSKFLLSLWSKNVC
jgi:hypothetical protein